MSLIKRIFDIFFASILIILTTVILLTITILIKLTSKGPALYWSKRIGKNNSIFLMPKFRSMYISTPEVATHLLTDSSRFITPIGKILRKTSLDELPQLYNILKGEMSFVGPRPALYNQDDLIDLRTRCGVHTLVPGVTGWAQINGRDEISIPEKVKLDESYFKHRNFFMDIKIIILTAYNVIKAKDISH